MIEKGTLIASAAIAGLLLGAPSIQAQYDGRTASNRHAIDEAPSSWRYDRYGYDNRNPRDDWFFDYYDYSDRTRGDPDTEIGIDDPFGIEEPFDLSGRGRGDSDMEIGGDDPFGIQEPFGLSGRGRGDADMEIGGDDPFGFDTQIGAYDDVGDAGWADV